LFGVLDVKVNAIEHTQYVKEKAVADGKLTLEHVKKYNKELEDAGIEKNKIAPMVLPDYSNPLVRKRQLTTHYEGTLR